MSKILVISFDLKEQMKQMREKPDILFFSLENQ